MGMTVNQRRTSDAEWIDRTHLNSITADVLIVVARNRTVGTLNLPGSRLIQRTSSRQALERTFTLFVNVANTKYPSVGRNGTRLTIPSQ